jgi:hypothetical protein
MAAAVGATTAELMHRGGHASPAAALRYQHASRARDQAIAQAMTGLTNLHPTERSASRTDRARPPEHLVRRTPKNTA